MDGQVFKSKDGFDSKGRQKIAVIMTQENNEQVNDGNPFPGKDIDGNKNMSLNSVFGDKIVATRKPMMAAQFVYPLASTDVNPPIVVGSGSLALEDSMLKLKTGTDANGSISVTSASYIRYLPGYESYILFTPAFDENINYRQESGLFDGENGFLIVYDGGKLYAVRYRDGEKSEHEIDTSKIMGGKFNPTFGNIYMIKYGFLGFAPIIFNVMLPSGGFQELYKIEYPNSSKKTHIANTFLPLFAKISSNGSTDGAELAIGSVSAGLVDGAITIGGSDDPTARFFSKRSLTVSASSGVLIAYRNKTKFGGKTNRISSLLKRMVAACERTKEEEIRILQDPAFVSGTWNDVSADSVLEFSTDLVLETGAEDGKTFLDWELSRVQNLTEDMSSQNLLLSPGSVAVFYFVSANSTEIKNSIRYADLF